MFCFIIRGLSGRLTFVLRKVWGVRFIKKKFRVIFVTFLYAIFISELSNEAIIIVFYKFLVISLFVTYHLVMSLTFHPTLYSSLLSILSLFSLTKPHLFSSKILSATPLSPSPSYYTNSYTNKSSTNTDFISFKTIPFPFLFYFHFYLPNRLWFYFLSNFIL